MNRGESLSTVWGCAVMSPVWSGGGNVHGRKIPAIMLLSLSFAIWPGCGNKGRDEVKDSDYKAPDIRQLSKEALEGLSEKRIFFAHQSVGSNIIDGIHLIKRTNPDLDIGITALEDIDAHGTKGIIHAAVGENTKPLTKIEEFKNIIESGVGDRIDVAMLKLCYVDVTSGTDVDELFDNYRETIENLKSGFPNVQFIHATVPLKTRTEGLKGFVKTVLGKNAGDLDNRSRNEYNSKLLRAYGNRDPIFDIAGVESTNPDGSIRSYRHRKRDYRCMAPEYSSDGGHLNDKGGVLLANELIRVLAQAD